MEGFIGVIEDYNGKGGTVIIPSSIGGIPATSIGRNALAGCIALENVVRR
jgi:hypothetical protein